MCGIFAILNYHSDINEVRYKALGLSKLLRHRGPDWSGCKIVKNNIFCHERLAIVGLDSGSQPIISQDGSIILSVNGEIYNHLELRKMLKGDVQFMTHSDCEIIIHLYEQIGVEVVHHLRGMFSFILYDSKKERYIVARDPLGITTLYYGNHSRHPETMYYSSEMKSLQETCDQINFFPPGHVYDSETKRIERYYNPSWWNKDAPIPSTPLDLTKLRESLEKSVRRRLMAEVPFGVLLSGGLDSSLIAAIAAREAEKSLGITDSDDGSAIANWPKIHSFSIGLPGSPDLIAAQEVAKFIGTKHHAMTFSIQEGHDALEDVIYHLETYDVTTIRASTPMYLLSRKIKAMGVKMVLSGEGSDEVFAGYLYFHAAPDKAQLHLETVDRVQNLHTADCLRANKSTMAWGLEARVPFLDTDFLDIAMTIDPEEKLIKPELKRMEKYIVRKAFDTPESPYLPHHILWRQKEQFSDGVGYGWIDSLKDRAQREVTDAQLASASERWSRDTPTTKEAYWYRTMFDRQFSNPISQFTVQRWIPRADWGCPEDPSGRAQKIHDKAY
ncbi:asparagine synthetase [Entomophthora muscae]|uniref:Asparagine synthetase n=1 Tax=Entomophthora muscae TaxID=34485 RepID=A0ACC2TGT3_9FUNG|nr:asparagine synthetase [Entomophthora muscae]